MRRLLRYRLFGHLNVTGEKFLKFIGINGIGALICFSLGYVLTEYVHMWYMASMLVGLVVGSTWNFLANAIWTFGGKRD
jgi:putative flippase GtrA